MKTISRLGYGVVLCCALFSTCSAISEPKCHFELTQQIQAKGKNIGEKKICIDKTNAQKQEHTQLNIRWGIFNYSLEAHDRYTYDEEKLKSIDSTIIEDKKSKQIKILFLEEFIEVLNADKNSINQEDSKHIPNKLFDLHSDELAQRLQYESRNTLNLNVLDLDDAIIKKSVIHLQGNDSLTIGKEHIETVKIRIDNEQDYTTKWYYLVGHIPVTVKETGRDKDGEYQVLPETIRIEKYTAPPLVGDGVRHR